VPTVYESVGIHFRNNEKARAQEGGGGESNTIKATEKEAKYCK
jgi:hypothetical protein